jgi:nitrogen regulatory protein P-II 1
MKTVEAVVRTSRLDDVVNRLYLIGIRGMTVEEVHGMSDSTVRAAGFWRGQRIEQHSEPRYQLIIVVNDDDVDNVVRAIVQTARTDAPGDGVVFVSDVDGIMRIRTGEVDADAI